MPFLSNSGSSVSIPLLILLCLAALLVLRALFRRERDVAQSSAVDDLQLLRDAERRVKAEGLDPNRRVILRVYRSDEGYTANDMAALLFFLGSHGVDATYETSTVGLGVGGLLQFTLLVPPAQRDKAETLLAKH